MIGTVDVTKRREKLVKQLGKLQRRHGQLAAQAEQAEADWHAALEADADTSAHTSRRRALALDIEDVRTELARVDGWIDEIDAEIERERRQREYDAAVEKFKTDAVRLVEMRGRQNAERRTAVDAVRAAAERYSTYVTELAELDRSVAARGTALGLEWSMPPIDGPMALSVALGRVDFAVQRGVGDVAVELGEAARSELPGL